MCFNSCLSIALNYISLFLLQFLIHTFDTGNSSSLPAEDEDDGKVLVLPQARGVENHRHADEPDDSDDGAAPAAHHGATKDDERPGNQEGGGTDASQYEHAKPGQ